jgi:hypothetical protein
MVFHYPRHTCFFGTFGHHASIDIGEVKKINPYFVTKKHINTPYFVTK